ncbi:uncharacterized protein LOC131659482 [Vicia villosa]|uniref:uncharacterized protein LOC131659482 n=1 Tax=Vicia villosa TaxID=3911 RepID=UPI00273CE9FD|nr:uncharacterized protein LOC131659482 [Vicia villosa]
MSLMIIKCGVPEAFKDTISKEITNAKDFLAKIEKHFAKIDKVEASTLLQSLISIKYKGKGNIRKYIMKMSNISSNKFMAQNLELSDNLHLVLISLPAQFGQFKINYN